MGATFQAITSGIGRAGNEIGIAAGANRDERRQQLSQRLGILQLLMSFYGLQQQIEQQKQLQKEREQAQPFGTVPTPGGGTSGVTFQPGKGFSTTPLVPGMDRGTVSKQLRSWASTAGSPGYKQALEGIASAVDVGLLDPQKAMEHAQAMLGAEAGKETQQKTRFKFEPSKGVITDDEGKEWSIYDPDLPPKLKQLVAAEQKRTEQKEQQKAIDEERRSRLTLERSMEMADVRDAVSASKEARQARTLADDVDKNVEAAKRGNAKASLALIFAAVRTMVQGAGRMTNVEIEQELKAGSFGQRIQRWYTQSVEGTLPVDQMEMIREIVQEGYEAKRGTAQQAWEAARPNKPLPPWLRPRQTQSPKKAPPPPPPGAVIVPH